jgi:hypothetical protein
MMVQECIGTCVVSLVCDSTYLGSYGSFRGMCNHDGSTNHKADMHRLRECLF